MRYLLAADTGGTFTDIVVFDQRMNTTQFGKTLTNYQDLVAGVLDGLSDTDGHLDEAAVFKHGTTHVINAFVQRKGARTALVTTEGFRDLLEIGRGNRASPLLTSRQLRRHSYCTLPGAVLERPHEARWTQS
jgi:N-methylhydantoinase A